MFWKKSATISNTKLDHLGLGGSISKTGTEEFYEIEPAIVLDVILDSSHVKLSDNFIDANNWPENINGSMPDTKDKDLSWVGRILVRLLYSHKNVDKEELIWAIPLESNVSEYPLVNEVVGIIKHFDKYFYSKKLNLFNFPNNNLDFMLELNNGGFVDKNGKQFGNRELISKEIDQLNSSDYKLFQGPQSKTRVNSGNGYVGAAGRYFYINNRIRNLKRREGDLMFESRFGQSIRFGTYDDDRNNDKGYNDNFKGYEDYKGRGVKFNYSSSIQNGTFEAGGGNPMILIRNRQRPLTEAGKSTRVYQNIPPVVGTSEEKNVGGYITEDVNNDGSSIHLTSGTTISKFVTNCLKSVWGFEQEEQSAFSSMVSFTKPILNGDQIVINSDRIIVSSKVGEILHFSKKRYAVVTDEECTIDAHKQIVLTTNTSTVINSPTIYLGQDGVQSEPALLGQTVVEWLTEFCDLFMSHTHWYKHRHPDAGSAHPNKTQLPVEVAKILALKDKLPTLLSKRVFVTGGGHAPGKDGGQL